MDITGNAAFGQKGYAYIGIQFANGSFYASTATNKGGCGAQGGGGENTLNFQASRSWTGSTSSVTPYTANMGSGTPLTINPEHITVKAWKRLT